MYMSYNSNSRSALNNKLPIGKRVLMLLNCIESIYFFIKIVTFSQILNYYKKQNLIFPLTDESNIDFIINDLTDIRNKTLILKNKYVIHRKTQKCKGIRFPFEKDEISKSIDNEIFELWKKYLT